LFELTNIQFVVLWLLFAVATKSVCSHTQISSALKLRRCAKGIELHDCLRSVLLCLLVGDLLVCVYMFRHALQTRGVVCDDVLSNLSTCCIFDTIGAILGGRNLFVCVLSCASFVCDLFECLFS
jgi:hypothetical protein